MEVEAPEEPIITWMQFLIHIGTVTLGILIALSLEGLVEWNHHRHMIREARENIRSEIEDNLKEMTGHLAGAKDNEADARNVLKWISDLQNKHNRSINSLRVSNNRADLSNTSWTTAQAVGTLSLMNYQEAKRMAAVYELQEEFQRLQLRAEDAAISGITLFSSSDFKPDKVPVRQLVEERKIIENYLAALAIQNQIGREMQKRYTDFLKAK